MKSYKTIFINGKQIRLHRYIMQCVLGRELNKNELVHHKDGNRFNNNINNLEITSRSEHKKIHDYIGEKTRFIKKYNYSKDDIGNMKELYKKYSAKYIAKIYNTTYGTIQRYVGKKIGKCVICGDIATHKIKQMCNKCYGK